MPRPEEREALRDLAKALDAHGLPFVLVGAGARVLLLEEAQDLAAGRATEDWDIGVQAGSWEDFQRLGQRLQAAGFRPGREEHRFRHASGIPVDLVPFGGLEGEPGIIRWPRQEHEMRVLGFAEALASADVLEMEGVRLPVAALPMQAVLKCFAFEDRRDADDLIDLWRLLLHGAGRGIERIFTELAEPLVAGALEFETAGAALLGLDAGRVLRPPTRRALLPIVRSLAVPGRPELAWLFQRLGHEAEELRRREQIARTFAAFAYGLGRDSGPRSRA